MPGKKKHNYLFIQSFIPEQFTVKAHPTLFGGIGGRAVSHKKGHYYSSGHALSKRAQNTHKIAKARTLCVHSVERFYKFNNY